MKRRTILISAIFLIGVVGGIALSQILSNTAQFSVWVDSNSSMKVELMDQPTGPIYQTHMYPDAIKLNVSNKDVNQGYNFELVITVLATGLDTSMIYMEISYSEGDQSNWGSYLPVTFQNLDGGNGVNASFVPTGIPAYFHVDAVDGGTWQIFYLISFQFNGATSGSYTFQFATWDGVGP